ncbi:MAG: zinc ribbon domain-containing protein [Chloroflexota bacterium]
MSAVIWVYALLLRLYPHRFQAEFGEEMEAVFAASVNEAAQGGPARLAATCLRELFDLPGSMLREHFQRSYHPTGDFPMSTTTCRHCGYAGPDDASYCAHCGRALVPIPLRVRLMSPISNTLDNAPRSLITLLCLSLLLIYSAQAYTLNISAGMYVPLSYVLLSLIMAVGSFIVGWQWDERLPNHRLVYRALTITVVILILLNVVLQVDRFMLSRPQGNEQTFVVDIPGIHSEAIARRVAGEECCAVHATREVYYSWPYGWLFIIYTLLFAVVGNLLKRKFQPPRFAGGSAA